MTFEEYLRSQAEGPYKALNEAHDRIRSRYNDQKKEDELVERVAKRVMYLIDTSQAVGKIKELQDMLNNLGN